MPDKASQKFRIAVCVILSGAFLYCVGAFTLAVEHEDTDRAISMCFGAGWWVLCLYAAWVQWK